MKVLVYVSVFEEIYVEGIGVVKEESVEEMIRKDMKKIGEDSEVEYSGGVWVLENEENGRIGFYDVLEVK